jgi:hypothetical protein
LSRAIRTIASAALLLLAFASPARAAFGIEAFDVVLTELGGAQATQAGSHPFAMTTKFGVTTEVDPELGEVPQASLKDMNLQLPPGLVGSPNAVPHCSGVDFANVSPIPPKLPACDDDTAVGVAAVRIKVLEEVSYYDAPIYNLEHPPGAPAKFGFVVLGDPVTFRAGIDPKPPYNVVARLTNTSQALAFYGAVVTIWGNPSAPQHDTERGSCVDVTKRMPTSEIASLGSCSGGGDERAFLTLPTSCRGPVATGFEAQPWQSPGEWVTGSSTSPLEVEGCSELEFNPTVAIQPTTASAESSSGLDVDISFEDDGVLDPQKRAESAAEKAVVALPEGVTVNPSQAEGLGACTVAQLENESPENAQGEGCPSSSKIGTVEVETPLLAGELLKGGVYVAQPYENQFGSLLALYVVVRDADLGIVLPLAGKVDVDPRTGRLTSTFENLPQIPFSRFHLHFRSGERSPLVTPKACGQYDIETVLTPWSDPSAPVTTTSSFTIVSGPDGGPCPSAAVDPFQPQFQAGSIDNAAGRYSPFYMRFTRNDGEQEMTRLSSILPPGLTGKIAGLTQCSQAAVEAAKAKKGLEELASPSCPASSQIGRTAAGAGVGPALTYVPGQLYLGGPYGGHPLSVVAIVPAVAGPFDLGTVVVQQALDLNPDTAEVEIDGAASDPFPHILQGIPLRLRDLRVYVDRPDFTLNPTSCEPLTTRASLYGSYVDPFTATDDVAAQLSAGYRAGACARLKFKPRLFLRFKGGTRRSDHPALRSVLVARKGDANVGRAVVTLPPSQQIDNAHLNNPCTRVQFNANQCPKKSILGIATAYTPLLDEPLKGRVYFRSNGGERLLPDIVADLRGQFHIVLVGAVTSKKKRLRTTFATVPDAPVSKFVLSLKGGDQGLLVNNRNICGRDYAAQVKLTAHNGRTHAFQQVVANSCKKKKRSSHR